MGTLDEESPNVITVPGFMTVDSLSDENWTLIAPRGGLLNAAYPIALDFSDPAFQLPDVDRLAELVNHAALDELVVKENTLSELSGLDVFTSLRVLLASSNWITTATLNLPSLVVLDLSHNLLSAIPNLKTLPNLQVLDLAANRITGHLYNLALNPKLLQVDLSSNQLSFPTPDAFEAELCAFLPLTLLMGISFVGNPCSPIVEQCHPAIVAAAPTIMTIDDQDVDPEVRDIAQAIDYKWANVFETMAEAERKTAPTVKPETRAIAKPRPGEAAERTQAPAALLELEKKAKVAPTWVTVRGVVYDPTGAYAMAVSVSIRDRPDLGTATSGANGDFSLKVPPSDKPYELIYTKKGFNSTAQAVTVSRDPTLVPAVSLSKLPGAAPGRKAPTPPVTFTGVVIDEEGNDLGGVSVFVKNQDNLGKATSSPDGAYNLRLSVPPGNYTLCYTKPGFEADTNEATVRSGQLSVQMPDVVLLSAPDRPPPVPSVSKVASLPSQQPPPKPASGPSQLITIIGAVLEDSGNSASGARVTLPARPAVKPAIVDRDGLYQISAEVPPGDYLLDISKEGFTPARRMFTVAPGMFSVEVEEVILPRCTPRRTPVSTPRVPAAGLARNEPLRSGDIGTTFLGIVVDIEDAPIPDVVLSMVGRSDLGSVKTEEDGVFEFTVHAKGNLTLQYAKSGYCSERIAVAAGIEREYECPDMVMIRSAGMGPTPRLAAGPRREVTIVGMALDENGEGMQGAVVTIRNAPTYRAITEDDGLFEMVASLPVGEIILLFEYPGFEAAEQQVQIVAGEDVTEVPEVVMLQHVDQMHPERFCLLQGLVITDEGEGIADVEVAVEGRPEFGTTMTSADGEFDLEVEAGGHEVLVYSKEGLATERVPTTIPERSGKAIQIDEVFMGPPAVKAKPPPAVAKPKPAAKSPPPPRSMIIEPKPAAESPPPPPRSMIIEPKPAAKSPPPPPSMIIEPKPAAKSPSMIIEPKPAAKPPPPAITEPPIVDAELLMALEQPQMEEKPLPYVAEAPLQAGAPPATVVELLPQGPQGVEPVPEPLALYQVPVEPPISKPSVNLVGICLDALGDSLGHVAISVEGHPEQRTFSEEDGLFEIQVYAGGELVLVFSKDGYSVKKEHVTVGHDQLQETPEILMTKELPSTAALTGLVMDTTGDGLASVQITVLNRPERSMTDANGQFELHLPPGTHCCMFFAKSGFESEYLTYMVPSSPSGIVPEVVLMDGDVFEAPILHGRVVGSTREALENVAVTLVNKPEYGTIRTGANGAFQLQAMGMQRVKVMFALDGFDVATLEVDVPQQGLMKLNEILLTEKGAKIPAITIPPQPAVPGQGSERAATYRTAMINKLQDELAERDAAAQQHEQQQKMEQEKLQIELEAERKARQDLEDKVQQQLEEERWRREDQESREKQEMLRRQEEEERREREEHEERKRREAEERRIAQEELQLSRLKFYVPRVLDLPRLEEALDVLAAETTKGAYNAHEFQKELLDATDTVRQFQIDVVEWDSKTERLMRELRSGRELLKDKAEDIEKIKARLAQIRVKVAHKLSDLKSKEEHVSLYKAKAERFVERIEFILGVREETCKDVPCNMTRLKKFLPEARKLADDAGQLAFEIQKWREALEYVNCVLRERYGTVFGWEAQVETLLSILNSFEAELRRSQSESFTWRELAERLLDLLTSVAPTVPEHVENAVELKRFVEEVQRKMAFVKDAERNAGIEWALEAANKIQLNDDARAACSDANRVIVDLEEWSDRMDRVLVEYNDSRKELGDWRHFTESLLRDAEEIVCDMETRTEQGVSVMADVEKWHESILSERGEWRASLFKDSDKWHFEMRKEGKIKSRERSLAEMLLAQKQKKLKVTRMPAQDWKARAEKESLGSVAALLRLEIEKWEEAIRQAENPPTPRPIDDEEEEEGEGEGGGPSTHPETPMTEVDRIKANMRKRKKEILHVLKTTPKAAPEAPATTSARRSSRLSDRGRLSSARKGTTDVPLTDRSGHVVLTADDGQGGVRVSARGRRKEATPRPDSLRGARESERLAALRGRVLDDTGAPLSGVAVSVLNRTDLQPSVSQSGGTYTLRVTCGALITLHFEKSGFEEDLLQLEVPLADTVEVPEVMVLHPMSEEMLLARKAVQEVPRPPRGSRGSGTLAKLTSFLRGVVVDLENQPVDGVVVRAVNHPELLPTTTNKDGFYDFKAHSGSTTILAFDCPGYTEERTQLLVPEADIVDVPDVKLQRGVKIFRRGQEDDKPVSSLPPQPVPPLPSQSPRVGVEVDVVEELTARSKVAPPPPGMTRKQFDELLALSPAQVASLPASDLIRYQTCVQHRTKTDHGPVLPEPIPEGMNPDEYTTLREATPADVIAISEKPAIDDTVRVLTEYQNTWAKRGGAVGVAPSSLAQQEYECLLTLPPQEIATLPIEGLAQLQEAQLCHRDRILQGRFGPTPPGASRDEFHRLMSMQPDHVASASEDEQDALRAMHVERLRLAADKGGRLQGPPPKGMPAAEYERLLNIPPHEVEDSPDVDAIREAHAHRASTADALGLPRRHGSPPHDMSEAEYESLLAIPADQVPALPANEQADLRRALRHRAGPLDPSLVEGGNEEPPASLGEDYLDLLASSPPEVDEMDATQLSRLQCAVQHRDRALDQNLVVGQPPPNLTVDEYETLLTATPEQCWKAIPTQLAHLQRAVQHQAMWRTRHATSGRRSRPQSLHSRIAPSGSSSSGGDETSAAVKDLREKAASLRSRLSLLTGGDDVSSVGVPPSSGTVTTPLHRSTGEPFADITVLEPARPLHTPAEELRTGVPSPFIPSWTGGNKTLEDWRKSTSSIGSNKSRDRSDRRRSLLRQSISMQSSSSGGAEQQPAMVGFDPTADSQAIPESIDERPMARRLPTRKSVTFTDTKAPVPPDHPQEGPLSPLPADSPRAIAASGSVALRERSQLLKEGPGSSVWGEQTLHALRSETAPVAQPLRSDVIGRLFPHEELNAWRTDCASNDVPFVNDQVVSEGWNATEDELKRSFFDYVLKTKLMLGSSVQRNVLAQDLYEIAKREYPPSSWAAFVRSSLGQSKRKELQRHRSDEDLRAQSFYDVDVLEGERLL